MFDFCDILRYTICLRVQGVGTNKSYNIFSIINSFSFNLQVESRFITVKEGGDPSFYIFRPTIPILCNLRDQINFQCELDINVIAPVMNDDGSPAVCLDGVTADQISFEAQECGKQLSSYSKFR